MQKAEQEITGPAFGGLGWAASAFTGAAGQAWTFITDEAAILDADAPPLSQPRPSMALDLAISLAGTLSPLICSSFLENRSCTVALHAD